MALKRTPISRMSDARRRSVEAGELTLAPGSTLSAGEGPRRGGGPERRTRMKARNPERAAERFRKTFGPEGFAKWLRKQPCEACGKMGPGNKNEVHHEPTRGAGGTWIDTVALCRSCHARRHDIGAPRFWREVGKDYGQATSVTQTRWLARTEGGRDE